MLRPLAPILLAAVTICCGVEGRPQGPEGGDGVTVLTSVSNAEGIDDESSSGGDRLDLGDDASSDPRDGCNYVDILFVIDNSGSMCLAQEGLAEVLPNLVDAMFDALPDETDIHVGLTTTTFGLGGQHLESMCWAHESDSEVEPYYNTPAEAIEGNGFQGRLYEWDDRPYFAGNTANAADRDALREWFPAAATSIGCSGGAFEFATAAAGFAVRDVNEATNAGFVRDEGGVLVLFVLSDGIDLTPDNTLDIHRDAVLEAKAGCGGGDCIVTAGLLNANCVPESEPMIWRFLNAFGKVPTWGDIHDPAGYADVVESAMAEAIVDTCEAVAPVG